MVGTCAQFFLCRFHIGVHGCTGAVGGNIQICVAVEIPVDFGGLCLEGRRHHGIVGPARGQQNTRDQSQLGVNLAHQLQAGFRPGGTAHATHNILLGYAGGVQARGGNGQAFRFLRTLGDQCDHHISVIVVSRRVVGIFHQCGVPVLDLHGADQGIGHSVDRLPVSHINAGRLVLLDVLGIVRIQHIHQNDGGIVENPEIHINALTKREILEVVGIPHGGLALRKAVTQFRCVCRLGRIVRQVNGGRSENHLEGGAALDRRGQARGLFLVVHAMLIGCHLLYLLLFLPLRLAVQCVNAAMFHFQLLHGLRQLIQRYG